jgi:signal transduction histidine kinase
MSAPAEILPMWKGRWRYPSLLSLLGTASPQRLDDASVVDAILRGIAEPVRDPQEAISVLVASGEYDTARTLAESGLVVGSAADEIDAEIDAAMRAAGAELARRENGLTQRARRVGLQDKPPNALVVLDERRADAVAELDAWEETITAAEAELRQRLEAELTAVLPGESAQPGESAEWADAVRACLEAGEFPAARQLLAEGPLTEAGGGPLTVPRWPAWPWPDRSITEILGWYRGLGPAPRTFLARWGPGETELLETVAGLRSGLGEDAVRRFAAALDRQLGAEDEIPHQVQPEGDGFRTHLADASADYRLPRLALPGRLPLYIGPPGWTPPETAPAVWFVPDVGAADAPAPPGVARIDATVLFQLIAPDRAQHPTSGSQRRVNLLRRLCRQFRLADVLGDSATSVIAGLPGYDPREAIAWYLDLLGCHLGKGVVDALLYDTGAYPPALWAAIARLAPEEGRPRELTLEDVDAWRQSGEAMRDLHDQVLGSVLPDREVAALLHAALLAYGGQPESVFTLRGLESHPDVGALLSGESISLSEAADRVAARVLLERKEPGIYGWSKPGLAMLLAVTNDIQAYLADDIRELAERRTRSLEIADLELRNTSLESAVHQLKTTFFVVKDILTELDAAGQRADDVRRARGLIDDLDDVWPKVAQSGGALSLLDRSSFDLTELLNGRRRYFSMNYTDIEVTMPPGGADGWAGVSVWGSRPLVKLALDNILNNAVRETRRKENGDRRIRLSLGVIPQESHEPPAWALVDIEDSGPGIPPDQIEALRTGNSGGMGINHAYHHIQYNGGELVISDRPSPDLGGAHVQIRLPLSGIIGDATDISADAAPW